MKFTKVTDKLPDYGIPVLIFFDGLTRDHIYILEGNVHDKNWFEPYHFCHGNVEEMQKIDCKDVDSWVYLPTPE
tara:strand:- start:325 stop:546 length:222 start_codon:yes stop_codon:yes gene_type:complete